MLQLLCVKLHSVFVGDFLLVYWLKEGSVSVLRVEEVMGDTSVGSEGEVKLGRTFHPVRIAAVGM